MRNIADIPTGLASLPTPHLPDFSLAPALIPAAVAAAIVGLSEAATVGRRSGGALVLMMRNRRFYSLTGVDYVKTLITHLRAHGHVVVLADVERDQQEALDRTGITALVGADNIVWREPVIGAAPVEAEKRARAQVTRAG